jgi:hypothetical protein
MPVMNLTETRIRDIEPGSGIWRDEQVRGLMVVSHKTTNTYAVQGDVRRNGRHIRTVRVKIDRVDRIGLREARRRAKELMSQIQSRIDPTSKPDETSITLKQALDVHLSERTFRPSTEKSYRYNVDHQLVRVPRESRSGSHTSRRQRAVRGNESQARQDDRRRRPCEYYAR